MSVAPPHRRGVLPNLPPTYQIGLESGSALRLPVASRLHDLGHPNPHSSTTHNWMMSNIWTRMATAMTENMSRTTMMTITTMTTMTTVTATRRIMKTPPTHQCHPPPNVEFLPLPALNHPPW